MQVRTTGALRRIDLQTLVALLPALLDEWAGLRFDGSGSVVNPVTGAPEPSFSLAGGRHRQPGARYTVVIAEPVYEVPTRDQARLAREGRRLARRGAGDEAWRAHLQRRRDVRVQVGVTRSTYFLTLRGDHDRQVAFTVTDELGWWTADVDVELLSMPRVELVAWVDLPAVMRDNGSPGCLVGLLGRSARGRAQLDLGPLTGRGGRLVEAGLRSRRFRGDGRVDVDVTTACWNITGSLRLNGRGLGRLALVLVGSRLRRHTEDALRGFWEGSEERVSELQFALARVTGAIEAEGGGPAFVRRLLWDPSFDRSVLIPLG